MKLITLVILFIGGTLAMAGSAAAQDEFVPPPGRLTVAGAGTYHGTVGTFCLVTDSAEGCSDATWIRPAKPIRLDPSANLQFRLGEGSRITEWQVMYADADEADPTDLEDLGGAEDVDLESVAFNGPPKGDWVMQVSVRFENEAMHGGALYYYRLAVGLPETDTPAHTRQLEAAPLPWPLLVLAGALFGWRVSRRGRPKQA